MTASAIKAGQGDTPGDDGIFWNAIPNEEYELTIRHDLYRFPDFYRTDEKDDNGNYKGNLLSGPPELRDLNGDRIEYTDIRDVPFANISKGNLSIHAQTPYIAGCDCTQLIHVLDGGDGINNDPLADINLNYLAGIKGSTMTKTITANSSEVENLNFCGGFEHIRTIGFDDILPMTTFGINGINFNEASPAEKEILKQDCLSSLSLIKDYINDLCIKHKLALKDCFIIGFSQGAMMAFEFGKYVNDTFAGCVLLSGRILPSEDHEKKYFIKTPVLIVHGDQDTVLEPKYFDEANKILGTSLFMHQSIMFKVPMILISISLCGISIDLGPDDWAAKCKTASQLSIALWTPCGSRISPEKTSNWPLTSEPQ